MDAVRLMDTVRLGVKTRFNACFKLNDQQPKSCHDEQRIIKWQKKVSASPLSLHPHPFHSTALPIQPSSEWRPEKQRGRSLLLLIGKIPIVRDGVRTFTSFFIVDFREGWIKE